MRIDTKVAVATAGSADVARARSSSPGTTAARRTSRSVARRWVGVLLAVGTVSAVACSPAVAVSAPSSPASGRPGHLLGVDVDSRHRVWVVGYRDAEGAPLIERKARAWHDSPAHGTSVFLQAVDFASSDDGWAVSNPYYTEHWNGRTWRRHQAPAPGDEPVYDDVATLGPRNAWAVGWFVNGDEDAAILIAHWNGSSWVQRSGPRLPNGGTLSSVSFSAPDDGWAVGGGLVLRWDGSHWLRVHGPGGTANLKSVTALSPTNVWAVGGGIYHWNGARWRSFALPVAGAQLNAVDASSRSTVWAVGSRCDGSGRCQTLTARWNGTGWMRVPSPTPFTSSKLAAVATEGPHDVWAVGSSVTNRGQQLVLHWNGHRWSES